MDWHILLNPILVSVVLLCILCLCRINVLMALFISAVAAGLIAGMPVNEIMTTFINGMGGNSETALSYILLGAFAAAMTHTGLAFVLSKRISLMIKSNALLLIGIITIMAVMSQNLIPVHIAFIPIIIPPLLHVMNRLKIDRRSVACALAFGLKAPYIAIPAGFGLIFKYTWFLGLAMIAGLLTAIFITYHKPREYKNLKINTETVEYQKRSIRLNRNHYITLLAAFATLGVQLWTGSLPLGALVGLCIIFGAQAIDHDKMDKVINEGVGLMGYVAFVMLVAAGFAMGLKATGGRDELVNAFVPLMMGNKLIAASLMLLIGLFITIGIGTSFGTIPILAVLFVPICVKLGFSLPATVIVMAAAAALGDAGSPASDTTLGPTAGLNADGQHDHIWDTCVPTFLHYNIALIIFALAAVLIFK